MLTRIASIMLGLSVCALFACDAKSTASKTVAEPAGNTSAASASTAEIVPSSVPGPLAAAGDEEELHTYHVTEMTCEGCENFLGASIAKLPGVLKVKASHTDERVWVVAKAGGIKDDEIIALITKTEHYGAELIPNEPAPVASSATVVAMPAEPIDAPAEAASGDEPNDAAAEPVGNDEP